MATGTRPHRTKHLTGQHPMPNTSKPPHRLYVYSGIPPVWLFFVLPKGTYYNLQFHEGGLRMQWDELQKSPPSSLNPLHLLSLTTFPWLARPVSREMGRLRFLRLAEYSTFLYPVYLGAALGQPPGSGIALKQKVARGSAKTAVITARKTASHLPAQQRYFISMPSFFIC